jgi:hypothetical protein
MDDCDESGSTGTLAVKPLGTSCPVGGSGCNSWRIVAARRGDRLQNTSQAETSKGRSGDAPLGYSGRIALRREQCNVDGQSGVFTVPCRADPTHARLDRDVPVTTQESQVTSPVARQRSINSLSPR